MPTFRKNSFDSEFLRYVLENLPASVPSDLMPLDYKEYDARELGCGSFGCAYKARKKGWVIKLTGDKSEAGLAAIASSRSRSTGIKAGMVKFGGVAAIPRTRMFLVWREEAFDVENLSEEDLFAIELLERYEQSVLTAARSQESLDRRKMLESEEFAYARRGVLSGLKSERWPRHVSESTLYELVNVDPRDTPFSPTNHLGGFASSIISAGHYLARLKRALIYPAAKPVAGICKTLVYLAKIGVYLMDMSANNMGYVKRAGKETLVLTDPQAWLPTGHVR